MEQSFIQAALDILTPVMESSIIVAAEYVKLCGRSTVTMKDMEYGMKYSARNVLGKGTGTMFPELQGDSDEDSEGSDVEEVDDDDEPFARYTGPQVKLIDDIHDAVDTWDAWEPIGTAEILLKAAVDKQAAKNSF